MSQCQVLEDTHKSRTSRATHRSPLNAQKRSISQAAVAAQRKGLVWGRDFLVWDFFRIGTRTVLCFWALSCSFALSYKPLSSAHVFDIVTSISSVFKAVVLSVFWSNKNDETMSPWRNDKISLPSNVEMLSQSTPTNRTVTSAAGMVSPKVPAIGKRPSTEVSFWLMAT